MKTQPVRAWNSLWILLPIAMEMPVAAGLVCVGPSNEDCSGAIVLTTGDPPVGLSAPLGCFTGPGGSAVGPVCALGVFDGDLDVGCEDWQLFEQAWTGLTPPVVVSACQAPFFVDGFEAGNTSAWTTVVP